MSNRIFLSHSSLDDVDAIALGEWLASEGWRDVFLDIDADRGIAPGQRWERELYSAASRCEAVIFLISASWVASDWCRREYELARRLNKALFAVIIDPNLSIRALPFDLKETWQALDLVGGQDATVFRVAVPSSHLERHVAYSRDGLRRLKRGLVQAGLDPSYFPWPPPEDPDRSPYRGLIPLEAADAGIFFGRDADIVEAIGHLRGLRAAVAPRLFVILGASGAGKSSFMRAGLLPRLRKDDRNFLPLAPLRPGRAALTDEQSLLGALEGLFPDRTRRDLNAAIQDGAPAVGALLREWAQAHSGGGHDLTADAPAIVIAIDQAEELFRADDKAESDRLLQLVSHLAMLDAPRVIVVFAIRSDSYDALEHAPALTGMRQTAFPLLPIPHSTYKDIIEGPARRAAEAGRRLSIDPRLTARLLAELGAGGGGDALPLLSFTLEQLYRDVHQQGALLASDYDAFGGLKGSIDRSVQRAFRHADADLRIPRDPRAREQLLRRALIPWLAGIDPASKSPRRNRARWTDIPREAAPLVDLLVSERLLVKGVTSRRETGGEDAGITTVEPAHEALLRLWGLLDDWLADDFGLLATLEGVQRAARDWTANGRADPWLAHRGDRLRDAQALDLRPDLAAKLDVIDRAYLSTCQARETALLAEAEQRRREREESQARQIADAKSIAGAQRRAARNRLAGAIVAVALAAVAAGFAVSFLHQRKIAENRATEAEVALLRVETRRKSQAGDILGAARAALEAHRKLPSPETRTSLLDAALAISPHMVGMLPPGSVEDPAAMAWIDDGHLAVAEPQRAVRVFRVVPGAVPALSGPEMTLPAAVDAVGERVNVAAIKPLRNGLLLVVYETGAVSGLRPGLPALDVATPRGGGEAFGTLLYRRVAFSKNGDLVALAGSDGALLIACREHSASATSLDCEVRARERTGRAAAISVDGRRAVFALSDGALKVYDTETGTPVGASEPSEQTMADAIEFGPRENQFLIAPGIGNGRAAAELVLADVGDRRGVVIATLGPATTIVNPFVTGDGIVLRACKAAGLCVARAARASGESPAELRDIEWLAPSRDPAGAAAMSVAMSIAMSDDGTRVATLDGNRRIALWAWPPDTSIYADPAPDCGAPWTAIAADRSTLVLGAANGAVAVLKPDRFSTDTDCRQPTRVRVTAVSRSAGATGIATSGGRLTILHDDGRISEGPSTSIEERQLVWTGEDLIFAFVSEGRAGLIDAADPNAHPVWLELQERRYAFGLTVDRTRKELLVSVDGGRIRIVGLQTRQESQSGLDRRRCTGRDGAAEPHQLGTNLSLSSDGRYLAVTDVGSSVLVFDRTSGACLTLATDAEAMAVAFRPDDQHQLAAIDQKDQITIWRLGPTGAERELTISPPPALRPDRQGSGGQATPTLVWTPTGLAVIGHFSGLFVIRLDEAQWERRIKELSGSEAPP